MKCRVLCSGVNEVNETMGARGKKGAFPALNYNTAVVSTSFTVCQYRVKTHVVESCHVSGHSDAHSLYTGDGLLVCCAGVRYCRV